MSTNPSSRSDRAARRAEDRPAAGGVATPPPPRRRDVLSAVLTVTAWVLLVPASSLLFLALLALLAGDGFTDAAPWWVALGMAAGVLGVPGVLLLALGWVRRHDAARRLERLRGPAAGPDRDAGAVDP